MDGSDWSLSSAQYSPASPSSIWLSCLVFLTRRLLFLALMLCMTQLTRKSHPFCPCTIVCKENFRIQLLEYFFQSMFREYEKYFDILKYKHFNMEI